MAKKKTTGASVGDLVRARIKALRQERGFTQEALCEAAGISVDAVSRIEGGSRVPGLDTLEKIAGALRVRVVDLVDAPPLPPSKTPVPLRRLAAMLQREPASVQRAAEQIVRALLKVLRDANEPSKKRRPRAGGR